MKQVIIIYIVLSVTVPLAARVDSIPKKQTYGIDIKLISAAVLAMASGASWGLHERVVNQNSVFMARFPRASVRFWGAGSWKNKYRGGVVKNGRRLIPVQFTDGKHLLASGTQVLGFGAGAMVVRNRKKWWWLVLDGLWVFGSYSLGNFITYNLLFR